MIVCAGSAADAAACHRVYFSAVRVGAASHYSEAQRHAWAPSEVAEPWMAQRLGDGITWLAQGNDGLAGFLTATPTGHLDLFFVVPEARRGPAAPLLYDTYLGWARTRRLTHLTTHASHLARRFLTRRGWQTRAEEQVRRNGVTLCRWQMELRLIEAG